jgi:hypothetical protein
VHVDYKVRDEMDKGRPGWFLHEVTVRDGVVT